MAQYCDELSMEEYRDAFAMEDECDGFEMLQDGEDDFRMWQGLVGPYFTPTVSPSGDLGWTNNGGLPNPSPVNIKGSPGTSLTIKGVAATVGDLPENAEQGDIWLVGAASPYTGYLRNDDSWVSLGQFTITTAVQSVNGKTGVVLLDAEDVGALPASTQIPAKTSDLTNDSGFVNAAGAAAAAPVQSVNGKTGAVSLDAEDVGAIPDGTLEKVTTVAFLHQADSECDSYASGNYGYSACTVIHNDDTCIIYDFGADTCKRLLAYLSANNITKVNAVIISHYHADHITLAALNAFLSAGLDLTECVFYLPHNGIDWTKFTGTTYLTLESNVKSALSSYTYYCPTTSPSVSNPHDIGVNVVAGSLPVQFSNVDASWYSDYYDWILNESNNVTKENGVYNPKTNYNNFSMCAMVSIGSHKVYLTGDIMMQAQDHVAPYAKEADLLQIPHHGLNCTESEKFMQNLNCRAAVVQGFYAEREEVVTIELRPMASRCRELGTVLSQLSSDVIVKFTWAEMHIDPDNTFQVSGRAIGQMIIDFVPTVVNQSWDGVSGTTFDMDNLGLGLHYCNSSAKSANIAHWPTIGSTKFGGAKVLCLPSTNLTSPTSGKVQLALALYDSRGLMAYRKFESNSWSAWRLFDSFFARPWTTPTVYKSRVTVTQGGYFYSGRRCEVAMVLTIVGSTFSANSYWAALTAMPAEEFPQALAVAVNGKPINAFVDGGYLYLCTGSAALADGDIVRVTGVYQTASAST